jgi:hypothetical protein
MRITLCARSKILQLLEPGGTFRVQATGSIEAGSFIDLIPNSPRSDTDVTISAVPHVVVDYNTSILMAHQVVDFDYETGEFIISNRGAE